ncbi:MAG: hypothetical protein KDC98_14300 [Planctomycetes bacterium]|nr:hypothetical protein [Planctomycetota bacterium]
MPKNIGLAILLLPMVGVAQCISGAGSTLPLTQDSISGPHAIGFPFPIYGTTYTDIHISDHGICFLTNGGVPAVPNAIPLVHSPAAMSLVANGPVVCPFWSDTIPGSAGTFSIDASATVCTVTWADVQSFGFAQPLMSFQLKLYPNGQLEFFYDMSVTNNSTYLATSQNGVIGVSSGAPSILPSPVDLSTSPSTTLDTVYEEFPIANTFDMNGDSLLLTPANPGWTVTWSADGAGCAHVTYYGAGCDGLQLTSTPPILGQDWDLTTTGLDTVVSQIGFTLFAFTRANPSLPLSVFGLNAPGCEAHLPATGIITRLIGANVGGTMTVTVHMPAVAPWLIGEKWTNQTFAFTSSNLAGIASSNAVHCTMGN